MYDVYCINRRLAGGRLEGMLYRITGMSCGTVDARPPMAEPERRDYRRTRLDVTDRRSTLPSQKTTDIVQITEAVKWTWKRLEQQGGKSWNRHQ